MEQTFSDRIGATPPRPLQIGTMDTALRNALWNWLCWALDRTAPYHRGQDSFEYWRNAAKGGLWDVVFHLPEDEIPQGHRIQPHAKQWFISAEWFGVYNVIQYILPRVNTFRGSYDKRTDAGTLLNYYLEREMAGYRAINNQIVEITAPVEIAEIERASECQRGFEGIAEHINSALALLGKKPEPDYANSMKESISAVEAAVKLLTGEKSGGIDAALKILEQKGAVHPAFKMAVSKLYAYTSDAGGIRHANIDASKVTFAEAKFMLVACSAFANLLIDSSR